MATNADAQARGFITPADTDLISEGDDAISQNARATVEQIDNTVEWVEGRFAQYRFALPAGTDLDAMTDRHDQGFYIISLGNSEGFGLPRSAGMLQVLVTSSGSAAVHLWQPISGPPLRRTYSLGSWSAWESTGGAGAGGVNYAIRHHLLREDFSGRMGKVDTGGKAAVALRFDHGLTKFSQIIRPLLQARGFKSTVAMNSRTWGEAQNSAVTPAVADTWTDVEFANHSATHEDAHTAEGLYDEIVTGLAELQSQLPNHSIDGWIVPGVGGSEYDGFGQGGTDAFASTVAGQLILGHHAWSSRANRRSFLQPLDGRLRTGYAHFTYEAQTVAATKARIDNAIAAKAGTTLMLHPDTLNTSGRMTTAQLTEVLDYIKGKVDAGELAVLTMGEMMVADSTRPPAPVPYFSGVRDVSSLITTGTAQWARLIRSGDLVELYVQNWDRQGAPSNSVVMTLPPGFRAGWTRRLTSSSSTGYPYTGTSGTVQYNGEPGTTILYGSWITPDAPPTTPPGTPA